MSLVYSLLSSWPRLDRINDIVGNQERVVNALPLLKKKTAALAREGVVIAARLVDGGRALHQGLEQKIVGLRLDARIAGGEHPHVGDEVLHVARREHLRLG